MTAAAAEWHRLRDVVDALGDSDFARPSLPGWTVAELVTHITATVRAVPQYLAKPAPEKAETGLLGYLGATGTVTTAVADRAREQAAERSPTEIREAFRTTVAEAEAALAAADPDRLVVARLGALPLADFLVTRCVEAVVHGLDLAAALGAPPDPAPEALKPVVRAFADLLVARAPGRAVEVRVPGPAGLAVQCVEGPRHTRGTPPNVVETDAVTFVALATGRAAWAGEVTRGRVRASGARADLSAYLPLMA